MRLRAHDPDRVRNAPASTNNAHNTRAPATAGTPECSIEYIGLFRTFSTITGRAAAIALPPPTVLTRHLLGPNERRATDRASPSAADRPRSRSSTAITNAHRHPETGQGIATSVPCQGWVLRW